MDEKTPLIDKDDTSSEKSKNGITNKGAKLTKEIYNDMKYKVQLNLLKNQLACDHFSSRQFNLFTVPQAFLTMTTSILAFLASSDLFTDEAKTKSIMTTVVGAIAAAVVFLQTMNGVCTYGTRASMHDSVAIDLEVLLDDFYVLKRKLANEETNDFIVGSNTINSGNGDAISIEDDEDDADGDSDMKTFELIETRLKQSRSGCKSSIPIELNECFNSLEYSLKLAFTIEAEHFLKDKYNITNIWNMICFKAYTILVEEITNSRWFPMCLPNSTKVVKATMITLQQQIKQYDKYLIREHVCGDKDSRSKKTTNTT